MSPLFGAPNDLAVIEADALAALSELVDPTALDAWRVHYLGRKGRLTTALRGMGAIPAEERPAAGQAANRVKVALESALEDRKASLAAAARAAQASQKIDVTLPARPTARGQLHPVTLMRRTVERIFRDMGFAVVEGPEVEWDTYNFDRLRIPADSSGARYVGHHVDRSPPRASRRSGDAAAHAHIAHANPLHGDAPAAHPRDRARHVLSL